VIVTGSIKDQKEKIYENIKNGETDMLLGLML
jgi:hypothetical protein